MHFMLVNDDGYTAEGITALAEACIRAGHRATVCAPDTQRSAAGHSMRAFFGPLEAKPFENGASRGWAINGTPGDCAKLGLWLLRNDKPDMVLSGINEGSNIGGACVYSGTVGAAMEASMSGTAAIASSLVTEIGNVGYTAAADVTVRFAEWAYSHPMPRGDIYSINVPAYPADKLKEAVFARLSPVLLEDPLFKESITADGVRQYDTIYSMNMLYSAPDMDLLLLRDGHVTITPLSWECSRMSAADGLIAPRVL